MNDQGRLFALPPRRGATISPCGRYRYDLWRAWSDQDPCGWPWHPMNYVMLNPSTADAAIDDATIRSCLRIARHVGCGYGGIVVTNLYPYRSTDRLAMLASPDRFGDLGESPPHLRNDDHIVTHASRAAIVVCAWGADAEQAVANRVLDMLLKEGIQPYCLGKTKDGHPKHPLYLPTDVKLEPYP